jgi:hypothetical protein
MAIQTQHSPLAQARATIRTEMAVNHIGPTRMASRIGMNGPEELAVFMDGEPTQTTLGKVYRWLNVPVTAWSEYMASIPPPEPEPDVIPADSIPDGFEIILKAKGGREVIGYPVLRLHHDLSMTLGRHARCLIGKPRYVRLMTNDETHELLIVPFGYRTSESYRMPEDGHLRCSPVMRTLHGWGWGIGEQIRGEAKYGGIVFSKAVQS